MVCVCVEGVGGGGGGGGRRGSPYEQVQSEEIALHFILNSCLNGVVACGFLFPEIFLSWGALWYALKHHASAPENRSFTHIFFIIPCSKQRGTKRRKRQIEENSEEPTTSNGSTNWKEKYIEAARNLAVLQRQHNQMRETWSKREDELQEYTILKKN